MPPKQQDNEIKQLLKEVSEKMSTLCTPEALRKKLSELFEEIRSAKSTYDSEIDRLTDKLSDLLNDKSIWF